jgi:hypothetical protein
MNEGIKATVVQWVWQHMSEFFAEGKHWLECQWDACLSTHSG